MQKELLRKGFFRSLIETAHDAVIAVDRYGTVLYWNRGAVRVLGYDAGEILGKSITVLMPESVREKHSCLFYNNRTIDGFQPVCTTVTSVCRKKSGDFIHAEVCMSSWGEDTGLYYTAIVRDVSKRIRAERMLAAVNNCLLSLGTSVEENIKDLVATAGRMLDGSMAVYAQKNDTGFEHFVSWRGAEQVTGISDVLETMWAMLQASPGCKPVICCDLNDGYGCAGERVAGMPGQQSGCIAAMVRFNNASTGIIAVFSHRDDVFDDQSRDMLSLIAQAAASEEIRLRVLERMEADRVRLLQSEKSLRLYSGKLLSVRDEERRQLARNLHDELGAMAVSLETKMHTIASGIENGAESTLISLEETREALRYWINRIHGIAVDGLPPDIELIGLAAAIRECCRKVAEGTGIDLDIRIDARIDSTAIAPETAAVLYRVTQEALNNIIRHARAKTASFEMSLNEKNLLYSIKDDGDGFCTKILTDALQQGSLGVDGMRERVEMLGGMFALRSQPGQGTRIEITIPRAGSVRQDADAPASVNKEKTHAEKLF